MERTPLSQQDREGTDPANGKTAQSIHKLQDCI